MVTGPTASQVIADAPCNKLPLCKDCQWLAGVYCQRPTGRYDLVMGGPELLANTLAAQERGSQLPIHCGALARFFQAKA